jgi:hypothetical protein
MFELRGLHVLMSVCSEARKAGLRITMHAGEVMNVAETEKIIGKYAVASQLTAAKLSAPFQPAAAFTPDRLGHVCVLVGVHFNKVAGEISFNCLRAGPN